MGLPSMGARVQIMGAKSRHLIQESCFQLQLLLGYALRVLIDWPSRSLGIIGVMKDGLRCRINREVRIWGPWIKFRREERRNG